MTDDCEQSDQDVLLLVTARGGSKGVPRKNIRFLAGKPLIVWTIEAAMSSKFKSRIIVSTDDVDIADASCIAGAETPFLRPAELAIETTSSEAVALHALDWLKENENYTPRLLVLLQPTSPFRSGSDIDNALRLQKETDADAVVSVTQSERPVQWLRTVDPNGRLVEIFDCAPITRRQDAEKLYQLNGAVYVIKSNVLRSGNTFYPTDCRAYIMPPESSLDIDSELDFLIADLLMQHQINNQYRKI